MKTYLDGPGLQYILEKLYSKFLEKEDKNNKVVSISSSSTDDEYPSAKAVYDAIQAVYDLIQNGGK